MAYSGLSGTSGSGLDVQDFGAIVAALGLPWTPGLFGFSTWSDAVQAINASNGLYATLLGTERPDLAPDAFIGSPGLVALVHLVNVYQQNVNGYLPTAAQAVATLGVSLVSGVPGTAGAVYNPRPATMPVSDVDWHAYAGSVIGFAQSLAQLFDAAEPALVAPSAAPVIVLSPQQAWNAEIQAGRFLTTPSGAQIPTKAILLGPTTLPDGMVYLQYRDPSGSQPVVWWNGPNYTPATYSGPLVKMANGDLMQLKDRGTGDWYRCMVVYQDDNACRPPLGYNGGYSLPVAVANSLSNQAGVVGAATPAPVTVAAPQPVARYAPPPVLLQPEQVDVSAVDPTQPVPSPTDPSGVTQATSPQVPVAIYSELPTPAGAPVPSTPNTSTLLLAGLAAVLGTLVIVSANKRGR